jgi:peptide/nickel transport system substrate-binding protein
MGTKSTPSAHHARSRRARDEWRGLIGLLVLLILAAAMGSGCSSEGSAEANPDIPTAPRRGGEVVLATAQEPPVLNHWLAIGGMAITQTITEGMRTPWLVLDEKRQWTPGILTREPTLENGDIKLMSDGRMRVALTLDPRATWSDKKPITCADFRFTWQTMLDDRWQIGSRIGWDRISKVDCPTPTSAVLHFSSQYAPFVQTILSTSPLPEHELRDKDFNQYWSNRITLSSGPFVFENWKRGVELTMVRNPNYWRAKTGARPYLDKLSVRFLPDAQTVKLGLRMGEVDMSGFAPDTNLPEELRSIPDVKSDIQPGAGWELLVINTQAPPLDNVHVRRAVTAAIDRRLITDTILRKQVPVLNSNLLPTQTPFYRPVFANVKPSPDVVSDEMTAAGFRREGSRWVDGKGKPAKLDFKTTSGNPMRLKSAQIMQSQLQDAGFEVSIGTEKPEVFFSGTIAPGYFHLSQFAFGVTTDPGQTYLFHCKEIPVAPNFQGKNDFRYCRKDVDRLLGLADETVDEIARAKLLVDLQKRLAQDVPFLPLYQTPETLAWNDRVHGVKPNPMGELLWNVESWWVDPS